MDKNKPTMIVAMPSSGSDWLAKVISTELDANYAREWFNPLCNWQKADALGDAGFACESVLYLSHLNKPAYEQNLMELVADFKEEGLTMTKEIWSQGKYAQLKEHFNIVGLARRVKDTFPPSRARVMNWYQSVAKQVYALADGGFYRTAEYGYEIMLQDHVADMEASGIPILWWDDLVEKDEESIATMFKGVDFLADHAKGLAGGIVTTRKPRE